MRLSTVESLSAWIRARTWGCKVIIIRWGREVSSFSSKSVEISQRMDQRQFNVRVTQKSNSGSSANLSWLSRTSVDFKLISLVQGKFWRSQESNGSQSTALWEKRSYSWLSARSFSFMTVFGSGVHSLRRAPKKFFKSFKLVHAHTNTQTIFTSPSPTSSGLI